MHPLNYDEDTINFCKENDIVIEAYAPFANGNSQLIENKTLNAIASRNDIDVHQLILLWCIQKDFVVLPRSTNEDRQLRNINLDGLSLSADDMAEIDDIRSKESYLMFKNY